MMIAQFFESVPANLAGWVACLAFTLMLLNEGFKFFKNVKGDPGQPPNEQIQSSQNALTERVENLEEDLSEIRREMKEDREAQTKSASIRAAGIYKKIDEVRAELSANLESVRQELTDNQRSLPNEIVTLLKNTNAI